jgi:hypothetical protein
MKKTPLVFLALFALSLCSFAIYENYEDNSPIEEAVRKEYLSLFRTEKLPYRIDKNSKVWKTMPIMTSAQSHFIPDLGTKRVSRFGPSRYCPDAMIVSNAVFDAVIYTRQYPDGDGRLFFILQTIDKKGDVIAEQTIYSSDYFNEKDSKESATINADLSIVLNVLHYDHNKERYKLINQTWTFTESGDIVTNQPLDTANPKSMKKG